MAAPLQEQTAVSAGSTGVRAPRSSVYGCARTSTTSRTLNHHAVRPGVRARLAKALSDASALAGWQALDVGTPGESWEHSERAKAAAREVGPAAPRVRDRRASVRPSRLGRVTAGGRAGRVRTSTGWRHRMGAHAKPGSLRHKWRRQRPPGTPARRVPRSTTRRTPCPPKTTRCRILSQRPRPLARQLSAALGDTGAIDELTTGLAGVGSYTRSEAGVRIDLATALLVRSEREAVEEHLREARVLVSRAGSPPAEAPDRTFHRARTFDRPAPSMTRRSLKGPRSR